MSLAERESMLQGSCTASIPTTMVTVHGRIMPSGSGQGDILADVHRSNHFNLFHF